MTGLFLIFFVALFFFLVYKGRDGLRQRVNAGAILTTNHLLAKGESWLPTRVNLPVSDNQAYSGFHRSEGKSWMALKSMPKQSRSYSGTRLLSVSTSILPSSFIQNSQISAQEIGEASNDGEVFTANQQWLDGRNPEPAEKRVLFFDSYHGGGDNGRQSASIMPNTPNSPSGGFPGNSQQRKKETKKIKAILQQLGVPLSAGANSTVTNDEHPSKHTAIGNAISSAGVAVAAVLYLLNKTPATSCIALAVLFCSLIYPTLTVLGYWKSKSWSRAISSVAIDVILVSAIAWAAWPEPPLITIEISRSTLPISIAPRSVDAVMELHPWLGMPDSSNWPAKDDLLRVRNDSGEDGFWPSPGELASSGEHGYEDVSFVEITNHSQQQIKKGKITFGVIYDKGTHQSCMPPTENAIHATNTVLIPPLDPGKSFIFAVVNESDLCTWIAPPSTVVMSLSGDIVERRKVPLIFDLTPLNIIGTQFPATSIKWQFLPPDNKAHYHPFQQRAYHKSDAVNEGKQ